jgi:signal transduction histidine kinase
VATHDPVTFDILQANVNLLAENERLEVERRRLLELDRLKTEFLARVSHDLRTPLNSIIGFSELMMADPHAGAHAGKGGHKNDHEYLTAINRNGRVLLAMINDLLDLSSLESGQISMRREWVPLGTLRDDIQAALGPAPLERNLHIEWPTAEQLAGRSAHVDRRRLGQALINLVDNARKFAATGGRITVVMESERAECRFIVTDDGPGVPMEDQDRIFRPFFQRSSTAMTPAGVGLGLAIVKGIVERHGGRIHLDSGIGKGCRFFITIPHDADPLVGRFAAG